MPILGTDVHDINFRLRFFVIITMGVVAFGSVAFWRGELLLASEYQEMPTTQYMLNKKKENEQIKQGLRSKLIQVPTE